MVQSDNANPLQLPNYTPVQGAHCHNIDSFFNVSAQKEGGIMGISEKYQCYVYGQCQVGFHLVN